MMEMICSQAVNVCLSMRVRVFQLVCVKYVFECMSV